MSAREYGDVSSYTLADGETFDDRGYLLTTNADGEVETISAGGDNGFGVNYKSTEDQDGNVVEGGTGGTGQIGVVRHSAAFPVRADSDIYTNGDHVYVSATTSGAVSTDDDAGDAEHVGVVVSDGHTDLTGYDDGEGAVLVSFSFN